MGPCCPEVERIGGGFANAYLIAQGDVVLLVDVGSPRQAQRIAPLVRERPRVWHLATHLHIDHIGGISHLRRLVPQVRLCFFEGARGLLEGREPLCVPPLRLWLRGVLRVWWQQGRHLPSPGELALMDRVGIPLPGLRRRAFPWGADRWLADGQELPEMPGWRLLHTPGHTRDSICLLGPEGTLLSGDTILNMRGRGELNRFCCDREELERSYRRLRRHAVRRLLPGHGRPLEAEGLLEGVLR